jgi:hypothetical protein
LVAGAVFALLAAGLGPPATHTGPNGFGLGLLYAQPQNLGQRVVMGSVVDAGSAPVASATVFLKDLKSKSIRSFTTTENGRFRFAQVSMSQDYDLWAEKNGKKTAVKTVSSWDTRPEFEVELKMK